MTTPADQCYINRIAFKIIRQQFKKTKPRMWINLNIYMVNGNPSRLVFLTGLPCTKIDNIFNTNVGMKLIVLKVNGNSDKPANRSEEAGKKIRFCSRLKAFLVERDA